jgi:hypothetical protein
MGVLVQRDPFPEAERNAAQAVEMANALVRELIKDLYER